MNASHWFYPLSLIFFSLGYVSANCLNGCRCSDEHDTAVCCLYPVMQTLDINAQTTFAPKSDFCPVNFQSDEPRWPYDASCLLSWRQLQIRLTPHSWPTSPLPPPTNPNTSCTNHLERLIITGTLIDDGLNDLHPRVLRDMFFRTRGMLVLRSLTIQQTQLREIKAGFMDELGALRVLDLEIRSNPQLTSEGLGVGWLASLSQLRLLDLSRNKLTSINLARWGFSLTKLGSLITLDLSGNQIAYLKPESFMRVSSVMKLDLSNNLLTSLPLSVFAGLDNLRILNLQGNRLTLGGLGIPPTHLPSILPNLRHLQLSLNPLLSINASNSRWWLNNGCPKYLTVVNFANLTYSQTIPPDSHLMLPPVAWDLCPALTQLILTNIQHLPCLSQQWLGVPPHTSSIPERMRIQPSTLKLCPPSTLTPLIASDLYHATKHSMSVNLTVPPPTVLTPHLLENDGIFLIEPSATVPNFLEEKSRLASWINEPSGVLDLSARRAVRVLKFHNLEVKAWLLYFLVFLLVLVASCIVVWGFVFLLKTCRRGKAFQKGPSGHRKHCCSSENGHLPHNTPSYCQPASLLSSCPPNKVAYTPLEMSINGEREIFSASPCHLTSSRMRLFSTTDSGMGDLTPFAMQQSVLTGLSPSSSHASVRVLHTGHLIQPQRFVARNPMRYHVPSFTSLRSANLYARQLDSTSMYQPYIVAPPKGLAATASTEDISIRPCSAFGEPIDDCAVSDNTAFCPSNYHRKSNV